MNTEIEVPKLESQQLAEIMDSPKFVAYRWYLEALLKHNHEALEKAEGNEILKLQGDCNRLRRLLDLRKFLTQSAKHTA